MKIKRLFLILLIGIFLIPILCVAIITLTVYYRSIAGMIPISDIHNSAALIPNAGDDERAVKLKQYAMEYLNSLPYSADCAAVSGNGLVLYSEMEDVPEGAVITQDAIRKFMLSGMGNYFYALDTNLYFLRQNGYIEEGSDPLGNEAFFFFITRIPKNDAERRSHLFTNFFFGLTIVCEIILLFAVILSVLIIRSIASSVEKLKDAAETLEAGNLNHEIKIKASNEITILASYLDKIRVRQKKEKLRNSNFIIGLSHDLRTPIALIKGYTEAIKDNLSSDPQFLENALNIILDKTGQLEAMLNSFIESVRIENSEWKGHLAECHLNSWLTGFAEGIAADGDLLGKKVKVEIDLPDNLYMMVDIEIFARFLENLLSNAFRYTKEGAEIAFAASWQPHSLEKKERRHETEKKGKNGVMKIVVADNGMGISEESLPFIFDAFYKEANSRRGEGHGFGLAIVKHIADTYGWEINVASKKGVGTAFTVSVFDCEYSWQSAVGRRQS